MNVLTLGELARVNCSTISCVGEFSSTNTDVHGSKRISIRCHELFSNEKVPLLEANVFLRCFAQE